jgi:SAM-dependent methyltransferase
MSVQEQERALIHWIRACGIAPVAEKRLLEIGCGAGSNLLHLLLLGFAPENLVGNELLPERATIARKRLPEAVRLWTGDAAEISPDAGPFDIVFQSTVFTSLLDDAFQERLAERMWAMVKPGGGILWYDFLFNNPNNPDVRGVPMKRIRVLFPQGRLRAWRLTLAPPISRRVTKVHPILYTLFNRLPFLRTHTLCWIAKPS